MVLEAVAQDTAYRNACGHSDHENAVIEGNAAVRRAILGSNDMELIRLYSDGPEFRHRLHQEVIDETYPTLHELLRPLSQDDIDRVIQGWNDKIESKHAVARYMEAHAREKDSAIRAARIKQHKIVFGKRHSFCYVVSPFCRSFSKDAGSIPRRS